MSKYKNITLFEGLNSLRFFAAFLVVMHHAETIRKKNGLDNFEWLGLFRNGSNAVTFFFVLSGFLITYLLLKEEGKTKTISIKNFYMKRVLRIWPLYFLLFIIGTLVLPQVFGLLHVNYEMPYTFGQVWYYFLFFLPGLVTFYFGHHFLEPLWSIGVEEVFYLVWAPIFKFFKGKILAVLLSVIGLKVVLMLLDVWILDNELLTFILNTFSFEAMAIGGLGAYFVFNRDRPIKELFIYKIGVQLVIYALLLAYLIFHCNINNVLWDSVFKVPVLSKLVIDFMFLYLIIGVSLVETNVFKLRSKFLSYLGEISYGIYMYHMLLIFAIVLFLKKYFISFGALAGSISFYLILFFAVVVVSALSKYFFEDYFLRLKKKFERPEVIK